MSWIRVECTGGQRYSAPSFSRPPALEGFEQLFRPPLKVRELRVFGPRYPLRRAEGYDYRSSGSEWDGGFGTETDAPDDSDDAEEHENVVLMDLIDVGGRLGECCVAVGDVDCTVASLRHRLQLVGVVLCGTAVRFIGRALDALCTLPPPPPLTMVSSATANRYGAGASAAAGGTSLTARRIPSASAASQPGTAVNRLFLERTRNGASHAPSSKIAPSPLALLTSAGGDVNGAPSSSRALGSDGGVFLFDTKGIPSPTTRPLRPPGAPVLAPPPVQPTAAPPQPASCALPETLTAAAAVRRRALLYFLAHNSVPLSLLYSQVAVSAPSPDASLQSTSTGSPNTGTGAPAVPASRASATAGSLPPSAVNSRSVALAPPSLAPSGHLDAVDADPQQHVQRTTAAAANSAPPPPPPAASSSPPPAASIPLSAIPSLVSGVSALDSSSKLREQGAWQELMQDASAATTAVLTVAYRALWGAFPLHAAAVHAALWKLPPGASTAAAPTQSSPGAAAATAAADDLLYPALPAGAEEISMMVAGFSPSGVLFASPFFTSQLSHAQRLLLSAYAIDSMSRAAAAATAAVASSSRGGAPPLLRCDHLPMSVPCGSERVVDVVFVTVGDALVVALAMTADMQRRRRIDFAASLSAYVSAANADAVWGNDDESSPSGEDPWSTAAAAGAPPSPEPPKATTLLLRHLSVVCRTATRPLSPAVSESVFMFTTLEGEMRRVEAEATARSARAAASGARGALSPPPGSPLDVGSHPNRRQTTSLAPHFTSFEMSGAAFGADGDAAANAVGDDDARAFPLSFCGLPFCFNRATVRSLQKRDRGGGSKKLTVSPTALPSQVAQDSRGRLTVAPSAGKPDEPALTLTAPRLQHVRRRESLMRSVLRRFRRSKGGAGGAGGGPSYLASASGRAAPSAVRRWALGRAGQLLLSLPPSVAWAYAAALVTRAELSCFRSLEGLGVHSFFWLQRPTPPELGGASPTCAASASRHVVGFFRPQLQRFRPSQGSTRRCPLVSVVDPTLGLAAAAALDGDAGGAAWDDYGTFGAGGLGDAAAGVIANDTDAGARGGGGEYEAAGGGNVRGAAAAPIGFSRFGDPGLALSPGTTPPAGGVLSSAGRHGMRSKSAARKAGGAGGGGGAAEPEEARGNSGRVRAGHGDAAGPSLVEDCAAAAVSRMDFQSQTTLLPAAALTERVAADASDTLPRMPPAGGAAAVLSPPISSSSSECFSDDESDGGGGDASSPSSCAAAAAVVTSISVVYPFKKVRRPKYAISATAASAVPPPPPSLAAAHDPISAGGGGGGASASGAGGRAGGSASEWLEVQGVLHVGGDVLGADTSVVSTLQRRSAKGLPGGDGDNSNNNSGGGMFSNPMEAMKTLCVELVYCQEAVHAIFETLA